MDQTIDRNNPTAAAYIPNKPLDLPEIRSVERSAIKKWLRQGFADVKQAPLISLSYGLLFAVAGMLFSALAVNNPALVFAAATGFFLVGPFLAVGLYDISRRLEHGHQARLSHSFGAIKRNIVGLGIYALVLGMIMVAWVRISAVVIAIYFDGATVMSEGYVAAFTSMLNADGAVLFVIAFMAAALAVGTFTFATGVVTAQMLIHRKTDIVTAAVTSIKVVRTNPKVMVLWALTIVVLIGAGMVTGFIGLIIAMPVVAHASWHAYKDLVKTSGV